MENFDVGIIGCGPSGVFSTFRIANNNNNIKTITFDIGRPMLKRRTQMHGFWGSAISSNTTLYLNNIDEVSKIVGDKKIKYAKNYLLEFISNFSDFKIYKDKNPHVSFCKKLKKYNYEIQLNDFIQLYPKDFHSMSKHMSNFFYDKPNTKFSFDNEILSISKDKNGFIINSSNGDYFCKKIIFCVGRSGWRFANNIFSKFGIIENNDFAKFGIKVELPTTHAKELGKSYCTLRNQNYTIGPFCWNGTVIPEDHFDTAISAFRSNEKRWETDKVSFNFISELYYKNNGFEQTDRIAKLTFILTNERILREKITTILNNNSKISVMPEYNWLKKGVLELSELLPDILIKGNFHIPTIIPMAPKIKLGDNLLTEVDGMFCAGESSGVSGILGAMISGIIAADEICK